MVAIINLPASKTVSSVQGRGKTRKGASTDGSLHSLHTASATVQAAVNADGCRVLIVDERAGESIESDLGTE